MTTTFTTSIKNITFVNNTVQQLDDLRTRRVSWETTDYKKANDGMYALLADTLAIYDENFLKATDQERKDLRKELEEKLKADGIKVQRNTITLTMLVRYVFGSDRKRAHGYAYVLKAAVSQQVAANALPAYIAEQGGIEEIKRKMVQSEKAKQRLAEIEQAKTEVLVELDQAAVNPLAKVKLSGLTGKYVILLAKPDVDGDASIVGALSDVEESLYNALIKKMAKVKANTNAESAALNKEATDLMAPVNPEEIETLLAA